MTVPIVLRRILFIPLLTCSKLGSAHLTASWAVNNMKSRLASKKYWSVIFAALVMAYISSRYLFVGSGLSVIPWGLLGILLGTIVAQDKREAYMIGAIYGFTLSFSFLWIDKAGHTSLTQFLFLLVIITLLGVFGAGCGALCSHIGYALRKLVVKN
jgi:hypothetical protein